ncbi:capsid assembly scaffolding protein Gp46 family protein [Clostridium muellerianum]|nr:hypothetical protein [Clostridium muellerianum]
MENLNKENQETTEVKDVNTEVKNDDADYTLKTKEEGMTQEEWLKKLQSETDKVRTEYSKQIKELKNQIEELTPKTKSPEEVEMEKRIKALEDKEKEVQAKEKLLNVTNKLQEQGLPSQLAKYLSGVEDVETEINSLKEIFNNGKLDNSYKPNNHKITKDVITKEQFTKMSYMERMNLFQSNEELYNKLSK